MTEQERIILIETEQLAKNNSRRLDNMSIEVKDLRDEQKALYTLTESVKNLVVKLTEVNDKLDDVKSEVNKKLDDVRDEFSNGRNEWYADKAQLEREIFEAKVEPDVDRSNRFKTFVWGLLAVIGGGIITAVLNLILK